MLTYYVKNVLSRHLSIFKTCQCSITPALQRSRTLCSTVTSPSEDLDHVRTLLQLCVDRYYISPGQVNMELLRRGMSCSYGPLGMELRRNLLEQWWHSVSRSTARVFGINTLSSSELTAADGQETLLRIIEPEGLKQILERQELSKGQLIQEVHELLQRSPSVRKSLLQGRTQCHSREHHSLAGLICTKISCNVPDSLFVCTTRW